MQSSKLHSRRYLISWDKEGGEKVNRARLEYEMKVRKVTAYMICDAIGMKPSAWYRRLRGDTEFTQGEIQAIINYLKLESPMGIFFTEEVS